MFFQYWVTFFSTIFIVYFYINIFYIYGTSDWFLIQFLHKFEIENQTTTTNTIRLLISIFLVSIFFKLGITPLHLLSIFFYTTYYFIVFFLFFLFFLLDFLSLFIVQYYTFLVFFILIGTLYVMVLLFDVNLLKAFFTYSTVINTIGFLVSFIALL